MSGPVNQTPWYGASPYYAPVPAMPAAVLPPAVAVSPYGLGQDAYVGLENGLHALMQALGPVAPPVPPDPVVPVAPAAPPVAPPEPSPAAAPPPAPEPKTEEKKEPQPEPEEDPAPRSYSVRRGDSLSEIARRELGDAGRWRELYDLNRGTIGSNPNLIIPGQSLKLPGDAKDAPRPSPAPHQEPAKVHVQSKPDRPHSDGPSTDRGKIYMAQPNGWTCGPTSLTMAMAAFGVKPSNSNTLWEAVRLSGANSNVGTPGNASLLGHAAEKVGMHSVFHSDPSPAAVREALKQGHGVIYNGSIRGLAGHFIYIAGLNKDGSFIIFDPARPEIHSWSDADLRHFGTGFSINPRGFAEVWK